MEWSQWESTGSAVTYVIGMNGESEKDVDDEQ